MEVSIAQAERVAERILTAMGYDADECAIIREVLIYAQARGNNQSLVKLITGGIGPNQAKGPPVIVRETPVSALFDGNLTQAMVAMQTVLDVVRSKARDTGICIAGLRNTTPSTGAIGYYVRRLAHSGLIGIMAAGSPNYVAVHGGIQPAIGTNPLAFGIPAKSGPIVFDMASAAIAYYGVKQADEAGEQLPGGVAIDAKGAPTRDPKAALEGAIRAFGGHKGSGLGIMIEILTGPLIEAGFCGLGPDQYGQFLIAIDPGIMTDAETFAGQVDKLTTHLKSGPRLTDTDNIQMPGERGDIQAEHAFKTGVINMDAAIWSRLEDAAKI